MLIHGTSLGRCEDTRNVQARRQAGGWGGGRGMQGGAHAPPPPYGQMTPIPYYYSHVTPNLKYSFVCYHNRPANNQSTIILGYYNNNDIKHVINMILAVWL